MSKLKLVRNKFLVLSIALITTILVIHIFTLLRFPVPHGDEAWMASRAWEFIQTGSSFGSLDRGVLDLFEGYQYFNPWLSSAIQSIGIRIFGEPSLLAIRVVSLISGFILLVAMYFIGYAFDGKRLGLLNVAFTAFSWPFFVSAHFGRPDIIAATFGFVGLSIHLNNRNSNHWISALAGLLTALAFEVHPHAIIYTPTILTLYLWKYKTGVFKSSDFWAFIGGTVIGYIFFLGLHIIPAPYTYIKLSQIVFSESHISPILTFDLYVITDAFKEMSLMMFVAYPQVLLGLLAIYKLIKKRPSYITNLLIIVGVLIFSFTLLVRNKFLLYYAILYSPALSLLLAYFFNDFLKKTVKTKIELMIRKLIVISILILPMLNLLQNNSLPSYQLLQSEVNKAVENGDVIMANQLYWFGLRDHTYYSWENIPFYLRFRPESNIQDLFLKLKPDIFIIDNHIENFLDESNVGYLYYEAFKIPKSDMEDLLNKYATLETTINLGRDNLVRIYRFDWE